MDNSSWLLGALVAFFGPLLCVGLLAGIHYALHPPR